MYDLGSNVVDKLDYILHYKSDVDFKINIYWNFCILISFIKSISAKISFWHARKIKFENELKYA